MIKEKLDEIKEYTKEKLGITDEGEDEDEDEDEIELPKWTGEATLELLNRAQPHQC